MPPSFSSTSVGNQPQLVGCVTGRRSVADVEDGAWQCVDVSGRGLILRAGTCYTMGNGHWKTYRTLEGGCPLHGQLEDVWQILTMR